MLFIPHFYSLIPEVKNIGSMIQKSLLHGGKNLKQMICSEKQLEDSGVLAALQFQENFAVFTLCSI